MNKTGEYYMWKLVVRFMIAVLSYMLNVSNWKKWSEILWMDLNKLYMSLEKEGEK